MWVVRGGTAAETGLGIERTYMYDVRGYPTYAAPGGREATPQKILRILQGSGRERGRDCAAAPVPVRRVSYVGQHRGGTR